jgi:Ca-activated chloride channel family protein
VVYNHPMAHVSSQAAHLLILSSLFCVGVAFPSLAAEESVSITPHFIGAIPAPPSSIIEAHLRIDSSLVQIPVHVTTAFGASITNLSRENFQILEDDVEQKVTHFAQDDAPVSVGLLFDASGSMQNKMRKSSEAVASFFKTANPEDEFFLVEFNERPKLAVSFTRDTDEIYRKAAHIRPFGRTSLLDAIHLASEQMKNARHLRKALVILSDGGDNRSRYTPSEIKNMLLESDVQVFSMGIFDPDGPKRTPEETNGPRLLDELAEQTGGQLYSVDKLDELASISTRIGNELRNQYLVGYSPSNPLRDGKYRHVKVKLIAPNGMANLRTYYRHGYYAPAQ